MLINLGINNSHTFAHNFAKIVSDYDSQQSCSQKLLLGVLLYKIPYQQNSGLLQQIMGPCTKIADLLFERAKGVSAPSKPPGYM